MPPSAEMKTLADRFLKKLFRNEIDFQLVAVIAELSEEQRM